jgi:L-ascorbate metabolism protein UlaG (beta-lactamase superfamily)
MPTTLERADLPELDGIVISHGRYDHRDLGALASYPDRDAASDIAPGTEIRIVPTGQVLKL